MMERELEPEYMDDAEESSAYDEMDHSAPNTAFVDRLAELGAGGSVLDLGCGPGHIPPMIAERLDGTFIVGIDAAQTMLALAERRRLASSVSSRIRYLACDAKNLPFPDGSFDAVVSNTVLHHIPDPVPFLAEARRVLASDGVLLIRDLYRPASPEAALALVDLHAADESQEQRELFRASLHAALTREELEDAARQAGFSRFEVVEDSDRHMSLQVHAELA